jgi:hypothetical protein
MPSQVYQMFERGLDAVKGWFDMSSLDKSADLNATLRAAFTVPAGRVVVLNDAGEFTTDRTGGNYGTVTYNDTAMPIFLLNGSTDADVYNDGTSPSTTVHWYGVSPAGTMSGLVATGGYELQTTEFDKDQTYAPNQPITATSSTAAATSGRITSAGITVYTTWICGICSTHVNGNAINDARQAANYDGDGVATGRNAHGIECLTFWPYLLPASSRQ